MNRKDNRPSFANIAKFHGITKAEFSNMARNKIKNGVLLEKLKQEFIAHLKEKDKKLVENYQIVNIPNIAGCYRKLFKKLKITDRQYITRFRKAKTLADGYGLNKNDSIYYCNKDKNYKETLSAEIKPNLIVKDYKEFI